MSSHGSLVELPPLHGCDDRRQVMRRHCGVEMQRLLGVRSTALLAPACLALPMPCLASVDPPRAMCYASKVEVSADPSPLKHGITLEVVCAHQSRAVAGIDRADSELVFRDGPHDLLATGRQWLDRYRKQNPNRLFFSTRSFNSIVFEKPEKRILPISVHSHALPQGGHAVLNGSVALYVVGRKTKTLETTADALRKGTPISLAVENLPPTVPIEAGTSNDSPMIRLTGGAVFVGLVEAPPGVTTTDFFGQRLLVVAEDVPADAPVALRVRLSERLEVPVHIEIDGGE